MKDKEDLKKIKASVVMDFGDKTYAILMGDKDICVKRSMLIASAPELLEALIKLTNYVSDDSPLRNTDEFDLAKSAIAKALGQQ